MRLLSLPLVAFLAITSPVSAAEYIYINSHDASWREQVLSFLKLHKPKPENVSGAFSGDFDLHVYAVKGTYNGTYSLANVQQGKGTPHVVITALMDGGTGKILGMSGNDVHILTWRNPD